MDRFRYFTEHMTMLQHGASGPLGRPAPTCRRAEGSAARSVQCRPMCVPVSGLQLDSAGSEGGRATRPGSKQGIFRTTMRPNEPCRTGYTKAWALRGRQQQASSQPLDPRPSSGGRPEGGASVENDLTGSQPRSASFVPVSPPPTGRQVARLQDRVAWKPWDLDLGRAMAGTGGSLPPRAGICAWKVLRACVRCRVSRVAN